MDHSAPGADGWSVLGKTDGNGNATWYAIAPNGDVTVDHVVTDPHGNSAGRYGTTIKDALGNTVLTDDFGLPTRTLTYPGPNNTTSQYTVTYTQKTGQAAFGCPLDEPQGYSENLITHILFPDDSTMDFAYEPVYNNSSYTTGRIKSVKLRTGTTIIYDYTGYGTHGVNCSDGSTAGFKKTTPDGVWTFTHSAPSGTNQLSTTTVTVPTLDVETYTFSGPYLVHRSDAFTATTICYNTNQTLATCPNPPSAPTPPITERDVYSYVTGITNPSLQVSLYDTYSRLTDVKTYDFGKSGANFATERQIWYGTYNTSGPFCPAQTEPVGSTGVTVPITGVVCADAVTTPGVPSAITVSYHLNTYASNTADVVTSYDQIGGVWQHTTIHYDSLGRLTETQGPNGEDSTISYTQCNSTLPNQYAYKASGATTLHTTITDADCAAEVPETVLDANNNPTIISYDTDPFWRPKSITDAAGAVTTLSYTATSKTSSTLVASGSVKEFVETLDSMGRPHVAQQRQGPSSTQYNSVETDYDINGRVSRVTTPYSAALGATNGGIVSTTYLYDGINRPTFITSPNGTVKSFTYTAGVNAGVSARDTLVALNAGPNGEHKQTQYEYNGLGQVTSVCEVTSMTGSYGCGQTTAKNGFKTSYTYSGPGNLLNIKQNDGGTPTQTRSFTYENSNTGRMLTAQTPEAGTFYLKYDTDATCGSTFIGAVVKKTDNGGGTTCISYDLLGRVTSKTYSGLNSANTPNQTFIYDNASNANITCPTGKNQLGQLAEVSTGGGAPNGYSDEGFCYDVVGKPTDMFSWILNTIWVHATETYFPTGIPKTLAITTQPTITYGLDPMARTVSANASRGQNPILTNVLYNTAGMPTEVDLGSGDSSTYGWLNGVRPMNSATFNVGSGSATNTLTWNANGTLQQLVITDTLNTADAQTCTYSYDDLQRQLTDNCGSTWNQTFSYDPFGNIKKSGNGNWQPVYDQTTNHYQSIGATYDLNGRLTNDTFDNPIQWDIDGNIYTQSNVGFVYDGLGRTAGYAVGSGFTNDIYAPDGSLFGAANNSGNILKMFVPLPMSEAVYSGGSLQHYRRNDWQGSVRVASTPSKTLFSDTAYSAFGETYAPKGTPNNQFAGLTSDISSGTEQVSLSRRYHPGQGRWISPDSIIPDLLNPETFNAYHYALNRPNSTVDPLGMREINDCLGCLNFGDPNAGIYEINGMQVSPAAFAGAVLGQGGSGLEFAFDPHSGIGPVTSGNLGALGDWQWQTAYFTKDCAGFFTDCGPMNYVSGGWTFVPTPSSGTGNNCQAPFLCNTVSVVRRPQQYKPVDPSPAGSKYVAFLGCMSNSVMETITDEEDGRGWTAYGFINAGALAAIRYKQANWIGITLVATAGAMDLGAMYKANGECTEQIYHWFR